MQRFTLCISALLSLLSTADRSDAVEIRQPTVKTTQTSPYYGARTYGGASEYVAPLYGTPVTYPSYPVQYQQAIPTTTNYPPAVAPTLQYPRYFGNVRPSTQSQWAPTYPVRTPVYHSPVRTRVPSYTLPVQNRHYQTNFPVAPFRCDPYTGCRGY